MRRPDGVPFRVLETRRLVLAAADRALIDADLAGREPLADALHAEVPAEWPPGLFSRAVMDLAREQLGSPAELGWSAWYLLGSSDKGPVLVGLCQFKGRPDSRGQVEISYAVLNGFQGCGYATEAVCCLSAWALRQPGVRSVTAETMPFLRKSIRVLEKAGFRPAGPGSEQGVVRYVLHKIPGR
jgi:RimJ/RimL family protein N-acetyltransferase